jgi:phospholipid-translocating ATPase
MALPELYRYGREGHWFNMKLFLVYMFDGIVQVRSKVVCQFHPV